MNVNTQPNILFLTHPEGDYGEAFLFGGLCTALGHNHVFDYPLKVSYHGETAHYDIPEQNLYNGCTAPYPWFGNGWEGKGFPARTTLTTAQEIREALENGFFDLVVMGSARLGVLRAFMELKDSLFEALNSGIPIAFHDGEDHDQLQWGTVSNCQVSHYLKRELSPVNPVREEINGVSLISFPFSAPDVMVPDVRKWKATPKEFDMVFLAGLSHPIRADVMRKLFDTAPAHFNNAFGMSEGSLHLLKGEQHPLKGFQEYAGILSRSRVNVSCRGWGYDTCRFWESAVSSLLMADTPQIQMPFPYTPMKNCLYYNGLEEIESLVRFVDKNLKKVEDMGEACIRHTSTHHTNSTRALWLLEQVFNR